MADKEVFRMDCLSFFCFESSVDLSDVKNENVEWQTRSEKNGKETDKRNGSSGNGTD